MTSWRSELVSTRSELAASRTETKALRAELAAQSSANAQLAFLVQKLLLRDRAGAEGTPREAIKRSCGEECVVMKGYVDFSEIQQKLEAQFHSLAC